MHVRMESLERRRLLAVNVFQEDETLEIESDETEAESIEVIFNGGNDVSVGGQNYVGVFQVNVRAATSIYAVSVTMSGDAMDTSIGIWLGAGSDVVDLSGVGEAVAVAGDLSAGNDRWTGTNDGDEDVNAGSGDDTLAGLAGNDELDGGSGSDLIDGGTGNDALYGGDGNDTIYGGTGNDALYGMNDNDSLLGEGGTDFLYGLAGNDTLDGGTGPDWFEGGDNDDLLRAVDLTEDHRIDGGAGDDTALFDNGIDPQPIDCEH